MTHIFYFYYYFMCLLISLCVRCSIFYQGTVAELSVFSLYPRSVEFFQKFAKKSISNFWLLSDSVRRSKSKTS